MRAALAFRRLLPVLLALNLATGLLHGASMMAAEAGPNAAHLMPREHCAGATDDATHSDPTTPADHEHTGSMLMLPGCPLANVAAIDPIVLADVTCNAGIVIGLRPLASLISADPRLLDPPPRAFFA